MKHLQGLTCNQTIYIVAVPRKLRCIFFQTMLYLSHIRPENGADQK